MLAGGAYIKQDLSHVVAILQKALMLYGCPERIVSDNGALFKAHLLKRAVDRLEINWERIEKGKPWRNLMETAVHEVTARSHTLTLTEEGKHRFRAVTADSYGSIVDQWFEIII